jgi:hypothetical protein
MVCVAIPHLRDYALTKNPVKKTGPNYTQIWRCKQIVTDFKNTYVYDIGREPAKSSTFDVD